MKVNDLKALFEKSGTIKNQPPPGSAYGNTIKPSNLNNKTITTHVEQHQKIPIVDPHPVEIPRTQVQEEEPRKFGIKNNDFMNELNKKLQNKTIKPKYYQDQSSTQEMVVQHTKAPQQVPIPLPKVIVTQRQSSRISKYKPQIIQNIQIPKFQEIKPHDIPVEYQQRPSPIVQQKQSQLDFDDIINGSMKRSKIQRFGTKARYGINQRHPTSHQEQLLFVEWEEQRKSQVEQTKKDAKENNEAISYLRDNKTTKPKEYKSCYYSKIPKDNKIRRVQRIVDFIFAKTSNETIANPRISKTEVNYNLMKLAMEQDPLKQMSQQLTAMPKSFEPSTVLLSEQIKIEQPLNNRISQRRSIKIIDPIIDPKKEQIGIKGQEMQQQPRSMFAMSKEMLAQINFKIKRREAVKEPNPQNNQELVRQKSPISKKKRHFQNFDDN